MNSQRNFIRPEGSLKLTVMHGNRLLDRVIDGRWCTIDTWPDVALPDGVYHLSDAIVPENNVHPQRFGGQVVHVDEHHVWQLSDNKVAKHRRSVFEKEPVVGCRYSISYNRGLGRMDEAGAHERVGKGRSHSI